MSTMPSAITPRWLRWLIGIYFIAISVNHLLWLYILMEAGRIDADIASKFTAIELPGARFRLFLGIANAAVALLAAISAVLLIWRGRAAILGTATFALMLVLYVADAVHLPLVVPAAILRSQDVAMAALCVLQLALWIWLMRRQGRAAGNSAAAS